MIQWYPVIDTKYIVLIDIPWCNENEKVSRHVLNKLNAFTKEKYDFKIVWKINKFRQLVPLKKKNPYPSCKIFEGVCSCKENYIGETKRNVMTRWNDHENQIKDSELAKHLFQYHVFHWNILMSALISICRKKPRTILIKRNTQPYMNKKIKKR